MDRSTNNGQYRIHIGAGVFECYYQHACPNKIITKKHKYCLKEECELEEGELERIARDIEIRD